jgi:hypothetical protein
MSSMNKKLIPDSETYPDFKEVGFMERGKPYVEMGYGVENIFKFFRVDFIHRLSYLDNPDVDKFKVLFSVQFSL